MSQYPWPWAIVTSDGSILRTLHPPSFSERERAYVQSMLLKIMEPSTVTDPAYGTPGQPLAQPAKVASTTPLNPPHARDTMSQGELAKEQGYLGDSCNDCGGWRMKQAGHCATCDDCGATTGCS